MIDMQHLKCGVCFEPFKKPKTIMQCMHTFCDDCLTTSLKTRKNCPTCNCSVLSMRETRVNPMLTSIMDKFAEEHGSKISVEPTISKTIGKKKTFHCKLCGKQKLAKCHPCGKSCGI